MVVHRIGENVGVVIGTDFLWKAMRVGKLRELLVDCSDEDWIYADRNGDFAVIKAANLDTLKETSYPADRIVDVIAEDVRSKES